MAPFQMFSGLQYHLYHLVGGVNPLFHIRTHTHIKTSLKYVDADDIPQTKVTQTEPCSKLNLVL